MKLHLEIWRQAGPTAEGHFESIDVDDAVPQMSILELLDHVNEGLIEAGKEPFAFASDCREGICGTCGLNVNGRPHGPEKNKPSCHQRLVSYSDGDTLKIEPLRSAAYPVIKDMIVDRSALDRVMQQGGYVSVNAGTAPDADTLHMNHHRRAGAGPRSLHRLWCLRRSLPQRCCTPVHWCQVGSPLPHAAGQGRARKACTQDGGRS